MLQVRAARAEDWPWIVEESREIGGPMIVSEGKLHDLTQHPALIAVSGDDRAGFAITRQDAEAVELLAIRALSQWGGVGTALLAAVEAEALDAGANRLWLCTTNDNLSALRFYQRRGFRLKALHVGAFREVLALKGYDPDERVFGADGVEIRDEIVLEKNLSHIVDRT